MIALDTRIGPTALACAALLTGCGGPLYTTMDGGTIPKHHVLMFDGDGDPVNPEGNLGPGKHTVLKSYTVMSDPEFDAYMHGSKGVFAGIRERFGQGQTARTRKILIFVHGGLNTQVGSLQRIMSRIDGETARLYDFIMQDGEGYYPIFINWQSSLWSSYFEHLFQIRQGRKQPLWRGLFSAPVIFVSELARSIARAPVTWGTQFINDGSTVPLFSAFYRDDADDVAKDLICRNGYDSQCREAFHFMEPPPCYPGSGWRENPQPSVKPPLGDAHPIAVGDDWRRCGEMTKSFFGYLLTLPTKLVAAPLLDVFGTSAWNNMLRRTQTLYHADGEYKSDMHGIRDGEEGLSRIKPSGGLAVFLRRLLEEIERDKAADVEWEITLVGHSMGSIVLNELLREYGNLPPGNGKALPIKAIVYLGAACSVKDYEAAVLPYLRDHPEVTFYNLVLHRQSEAREVAWEPFDVVPFDPPPRGSLLVWVDNFLSNPETPLDRTLGRYDNFLVALHNTPADLRHQVVIKAFAAGKKIGTEKSTNYVRTHSDLAAQFKFWRPACWQTTGTTPQSCFHKGD